MIHQEPAVVYWLDNALYLNITKQCSNNCWFCFRNYKQGVGGFNLKLEKEPSAVEVISNLEKTLPLRRWSEVVFCGFGEPTTRLDVLLEIASWIRSNHSSLPIRLDTNGHGYALNENRDVAQELKAAGVTKTSVSLNGYNDQTYNENCRPKISHGFESTIEFIRKAKAKTLEVEASVVRLPQIDVQKVKAIADELGVPVRIRRYHPGFS
jgi:cyclic pyranopterin phosphate synthase